MTALLILVSMSSCMKKATETKAKCGEYEAFDSVSRSCYSLSSHPAAPKANLESITLEAEVAKKIRLTYTDANSDLALSCRAVVSSGSGSNVLVISPAMTDGTYVMALSEIKNAMTGLYYALPGGYTFTSNAQVNLLAVDAIYSNVYQSFNSDSIKSNSLLVKSNVESMIMNGQNALTILGTGHSYYAQIASNLEFLTNKQVEFIRVSSSIENNCICDGGECYTSVIPKMGYHGQNGFEYSVTDKDGRSSARPVTVKVNPLNPQLNSLRPIAESIHYELNEESTNLQTVFSYTGLNPGPGRNLYPYQTTNFTYLFQGTTTSCTALGCYGQTYRGGRVSGCLNLIGSDGPTDRTCIYSPPTNNENNFISGILQTPIEGTRVIDLIDFKALQKGTYGNQIQLQFIDIKSLTVKDYDSFATKDQLYGLIDTAKGESYLRVEGNRIKIFLNLGVTTRQNIVSLINSHPQAGRLVLATVAPLNFGLSNASYLTGSLPVNLQGGNDGYDYFSYTTNNGTSTSLNTTNISISMVPENDPPRVPSQYVGECTTPEMTSECIPAVVTLTEGQAGVSSFDIKFRDVDINTASSFTIKKKVIEGLCTASTVGLNIDSLTNSSYFTMTPLTYPDPIAPVGTVKFSHTIGLQPLLDFNGNACLYYQVTDAFGAVSMVQGVPVNVLPVNDPPMLGSVAGGVFTEFNAAPTINLTTSIDEDFAGPNTDSTFIFYSQAGGQGGFENNQTLALAVNSSNNTVIDFSKKCEVTPTDNVYLDTSNYRCYKTADNSLFSSVTIITDPVPVMISGIKTLKNTIIFIPKKDQSGVTDFTISVTDGGEIPAMMTTYNFSVEVNYVDDPPYFIPGAGENLAILHSNEGGMIQTFPFRVNEDEGDTVSEDFQGISIVSITSDNPSILPDSNITFFTDENSNGVEDTNEARVVGESLEIGKNAAGDAKLHPFYLKLKPIAGAAGSTNIVVTITDGFTPVSHRFSYVVRPIAAIHRGWANISSVGIKTNKKSEPVEVSIDGSGNTLMTSDLKCNYNKTSDALKCNASNCIGSQPPNSIVTASGVNVLYWDSNNQRCYRSKEANNYSWVEFNTSCPVTRQATMCAGNNCIFDSSTEPAIGTRVPDFIGQYMYDLDTKTCYRAQDVTAASWAVYIPSKVTLAWNPFTITGLGTYGTVGVKGYNVYRREPGRDYDFGINGHLTDHLSTNGMTISGASIRTFTDTTAIAGKVYYYIVRPVDSMTSFATFTGETFSEVRIVAAPENYAFVHRWMVNQEVCRGMNMTESPTSNMPHTIDPNNNYTCPYVGPGRSLNGLGQSVYDYGRDLLVDIQEAGCSYAEAPKCSNNGCVGKTPPTSTLGVDEDDLYYDRSNGMCHVFRTGAWQILDTLADGTVGNIVASKVNTALNPPMVNVSKIKAQEMCEDRDIPVISGLTVQPTKSILPNKKDYIGYSAHKVSLEYSEDIKSLELGLSLNNQSTCNGSYANGLNSSFTNTDVPLHSYMFSIAGTESSLIRSLHTGSVQWGMSKSTNQCVSRYGIQDLYGNVAEWVNDSFICDDTFFICSGIKDAVGPLVSERSFKANEFGDTDDKTYAIDGIVGPGPIIESSLPVAYIKQWTLTTNQNNASLFNYPLGLPITDAITMYDGVSNPADFSSAFDWLLNTNASNSKLNDDGFVLYRDNIITDPSGTRDVTVGGSFKSDRYPGRFTTELIGETEPLRNDVGFRCAIPVENGNYPNTDPYHNYTY